MSSNSVLKSAKNINQNKEINKSENTPSPKKTVEMFSATKINAFQFMMDSRHRIIGSNSCGKEKDVETTPAKDPTKKSKLNKRKEIFESWSEKKGNTKRKLDEDEAKEKYITKTLNRRAKRMKKMLNIEDENEEIISPRKRQVTRVLQSDSDNSNDSGKPVESSSEHSSLSAETSREEKVISNTEVYVEENEKEDTDDEIFPIEKYSANRKIHNISIEEIDSSENSTNISNSANQSKNEEALEPDINTDETSNESNSKNSDISNETQSTNSKNSRTSKTPGKVKEKLNFTPERSKSKLTTPKSKRKKSKTSLSLKKTLDTHVVDLSNGEIFPEIPLTPDRNNGSTERIQFTPRTWRMKVKLLEKENVLEEQKHNLICINDETDDEFENKVISKLKSVENTFNSAPNFSEGGKQVKLAPMFMIQAKKMEQQAKKNFLYSRIPSAAKKMILKQQSVIEIEFDSFPKISHIQQRLAEEEIFWNLPNISLSESDTDSSYEIPDNTFTMGTFTGCTLISSPSKLSQIAPPTKIQNIKHLIHELKVENPNYPVFKTFRLLRERNQKKIVEPPKKIEEPKVVKRKRGRPKKSQNATKVENLNSTPINLTETLTDDCCMWTEKYKPQTFDDLIGNVSVVTELKDWLRSWLSYSDLKKSQIRKRRHSNSSDDFCSDSDSRDSNRTLHNTVILIGPYGSGKTCSVYAICNDLNINVIEINASSRRTGKRILTELQEATQSHQVKNTDSSSVSSFFQTSAPKLGEENKKFSLLLIEDVDIVFEDQDDGFISAITTLMLTSKRPMILTTTDPTCAHLQKLMAQLHVLKYKPLEPETMAVWVQILGLIEGVRINKAQIIQLLQINKGDLRKTLLQLQFWTQTGGDLTKLESKLFKTTPITNSVDISEQDDSNLSWLNSDETPETNYIHQTCLQNFLPYFESDKKTHMPYPIDLGLLWWNTPNILNISHTTPTGSPLPNPPTADLDLAVNLINTISFADVLYTRRKFDCDFEPTQNYWQTRPVNSLSFMENFEMYQQCDGLTQEIVHWLVENNIETIQTNGQSEFMVNIALPSNDKRRWRIKQHDAMKELSTLAPPYCELDRNAICTDYMPLLRTVNRIENNRSIKNTTKRNNRFYHYLKNLNLHLSDSTCLTVCNTLAIEKSF